MIKRDKSDIFIDNLSRLRQDARLIREEEILFLEAYFSSMITGEMTFDKAVKHLLGGYKRLIETSENAYITEKVVACRTLAKHFPQISFLSKGFSASIITHQPDMSARISFWQSHPFSSKGVEHFSSLFLSAEPIPVNSFSDVCDRAVNQASDFGIIPVENTMDGRLTAFYKMLDRYELKICAVCDVDDPEADMTTRLALVTKNVYVFEDARPCYLEFSYVKSEDDTKSDLIGVAEAMGMSLTGLSFLPLSYRIGASVETMRLKLAKGNVLPFLIYLYAFCEDINMLGFYVKI